MSTTSNAPMASQMTQGAAVVQAVREVLKSEYKEGSKVTLNDDQRKMVTDILVKGFSDRRIPLKASTANDAKLSDPKQLQAYVKGLINNWLAKSPELNGKPKKMKSAPAVTAEKEVPESKQDPKGSGITKSGSESLPSSKPAQPTKK